jgi:hypothetical protein
MLQNSIPGLIPQETKALGMLGKNSSGHFLVPFTLAFVSLFGCLIFLLVSCFQISHWQLAAVSLYPFHPRLSYIQDTYGSIELETLDWSVLREASLLQTPSKQKKLQDQVQDTDTVSGCSILDLSRGLAMLGRYCLSWEEGLVVPQSGTHTN